MIVDHLDACGRYGRLDGRFDLAFAYLRKVVAEGGAPADVVLAPDEVWSSVVNKPGRSAEGAGFEYHARFADVHLCLRGEERLGWRPDAQGLPVQRAFSEERDFGLYAGTPDHFVPLRGSRFAILFPGELHAPLVADHELTKICVKVRLASFV